MGGLLNVQQLTKTPEKMRRAVSFSIQGTWTHAHNQSSAWFGLIGWMEKGCRFSSIADQKTQRIKTQDEKTTKKREMENREREKRSVNHESVLAGTESGTQNPLFELARALKT